MNGRRAGRLAAAALLAFVAAACSRPSERSTIDAYLGLDAAGGATSGASYRADPNDYRNALATKLADAAESSLLALEFVDHPSIARLDADIARWDEQFALFSGMRVGVSLVIAPDAADRETEAAALEAVLDRLNDLLPNHAIVVGYRGDPSIETAFRAAADGAGAGFVALPARGAGRDADPGGDADALAAPMIAALQLERSPLLLAIGF